MGGSLNSKPVVEVTAPGVLLVRYTDADNMLPQNQDLLLEQIRAEASSGAVGIIFVLAEGIRLVAPAVPRFWLEVTSTPAYRLRAMAVVSTSVAVRTAASAFGVANSLRGIDLQVRSNTEAAPAMSWVQTRIAETRAAKTA